MLFECCCCLHGGRGLRYKRDSSSSFLGYLYSHMFCFFLSFLVISGELYFSAEGFEPDDGPEMPKDNVLR